jgi:hypothetical protein
MSSLDIVSIFLASPRIVRAKGEYWKAVACKWSKITSSVCPSTYNFPHTSFITVRSRKQNQVRLYP